ncbi:hypothetical protein PRIC1_002284 [Phytophthora ramorum]
MENKKEETSEWRAVGGAKRRQVQESKENGASHQRLMKNKQSGRKLSPVRPKTVGGSNERSGKGQGPKPGRMGMGDGKIVFKQLRNYLINKASKKYVYDTELRLTEMASERRFQEH